MEETSEQASIAPGRSDFRRRLLDGLEQSIREIGLQRTQIGDIVRNARTSKRTFYECFADKETCFAELIDQWSRETSLRVEGAIDSDAPWDRQIDQAVDAYVGILSSKPELSVTFTRELPSLGARGGALQERDLDRFVRLVLEVTRNPSMTRAGVSPVDRGTAVMLIGGVNEILERALRADEPPESVAGTIKRVIKLVIGPRPPGFAPH